MFITRILPIVIIFISTSLYAQTGSYDFETIQSNGPLPEFFVKSVDEAYSTNLEKISHKADKRKRAAQEEFYLQSAFNIHDILLSGSILYGDPVSTYLNKVLDVILKDDPELRSKLTVLTMKSDVVNAYATDEGIIFFSLALFSRLENESQAAFILAHEITHFKNKHVIDGYVQKVDLRQGRGRYSHLSMGDRNVAKFSFSKDLEMEADRQGLRMFLKSEYTPDYVEPLFDILKLSYLPMARDTFYMSFFEDEYLKFPTDYHIDVLNEISAEDDENDRTSTHPNAMKRKSAAKGIIQYQDTVKGTEKFIVSEEEFYEVQKLCKYEVCRQNLLSGDYKNAIYNSYALLKEDSNSRYLKKNIGKGLYYEAADAINSFDFDFNFNFSFGSSKREMEGPAHQLYHFIDQMKDRELATLALKYNWALRDPNIEDEELDLAIDHLFEIIVEELEIDTSWYYTDTTGFQLDSLEDDDYIRFAFIEELKDTAFLNKFIKTMDEYELKENQKELVTSITYQVRLKNERKEERNKRKYGEALGIDKVVILNPRYKRIDKRKEVSVQYLESESFMLNYDDNVQYCADKLGFEVEVLNTKNFKANDTLSFRDNALLYEWFGEKMNNPGSKRVSPIHNEIQPFIEKYNTSKFAMFAATSKTYRKYGKLRTLVISAVTVVFLPYGVVYFVSADHNLRYMTMLYDIKTGELQLSENKMIKAKNNERIFKSNMYHTLKQYHQIR